MKLNRSSGVLAHPTSFPSKYGIGDFGYEAYRFVDFLQRSGQKFWQVLPLNPTSFGDSPYQSFSSFAGNTLLISPELLLNDGLLEDENLSQVPFFDPAFVDYEKVFQYKEILFHKAHKKFNGKKKNEMKEYFDFCEENQWWLDDYALFAAIKNHLIAKRRYLKGSIDFTNYARKYHQDLDKNVIYDFYFGAVFNSWPEDILLRKKDAMKRWQNTLVSEIDYLKFLQYQFFKQWKALKEYANERNIQIIGDIPIFVSMDSADVWANAQLFQLDERGCPTVVAGVPPDYFSETGQRWGNPLYQWKEHEKTNFQWWIKRIKATLSLTDYVRIDHFRGFDSYWEIPFGEETAVHGTWVKGPGIQFFKEVQKELGDLNIIAEDLGIITGDVRKLRDDTGFPGMVILQFAFDSGNGNAYLPHNYPTNNCVVYTGTHDNDTTVGWYHKLGDDAKDYYRRYLNVSGDDPAWELIRLCYSSSAVLSIIPVQDLMGLDSEARMNIPGNAAGNWKFRFTEDMLSTEICNRLLTLNMLFNR